MLSRNRPADLAVLIGSTIAAHWLAPRPIYRVRSRQVYLGLSGARR